MLFITDDSILLYVVLTELMNFSCKLKCLSVLNRKFQFKELKVFSQSMGSRIPGICFSLVKNVTSSKILIFCPIYGPLR